MGQPSTPSSPHPGLADYYERLELLDFDAADAQQLAAFGRRFAAIAPAVAERFYAHLTSFRATAQHLDEATLDRLHAAQQDSFAQLFAGEYGRAYAEDRLRIGAIHQQVGLGPTWYVGAYALFLRLLLPALMSHAGDDPARLQACLGAVIKVIFLDLGLAVDTCLDAEERDRRALRELADQVIASVPAGLAVVDAELRLVHANRAFRESFGAAEVRPGRPLLEILGAPALERHLRAACTSGATRAKLLVQLRGAGGSRPARVAVAPLPPTADAAARVLCVVEDLAEEVHLTARAHASERSFHEVIERTSDAMVLVGGDGTIRYVNQAAAELARCGRERLVGHELAALFAAPHREAVTRTVARCTSLARVVPPGPGTTGHGTWPPATGASSLESVHLVSLTRRDGDEVPVELRLRSQRIDGESVCLAVLRDVTTQRAETTYQRFEVGFRGVLEQSASFVAVHRGARVVYLNPTARDLLGLDEAAVAGGLALADLVPPADHEIAAALAQTGLGELYVERELRLRPRSGPAVALRYASMPLVFAGEPARLLVGEARPTGPLVDTRLMQLDRLIPRGALAAAAAGALEEPLADLAADLRTARAELERLVPGADGAGPRAPGEVGAALDAAERDAAQASRIVDHLRAVAGDDRAGVLVDLRGVLESAVQLAQGEVAARARLRADYGEVPLVEASATALAQVFLNLLVNAAEAIAPGAAERNLVRVRCYSEAGWAVVEVEDTGCGIPATHRGRLFQPFFTTKDARRAAGLGLAIARGTVTALGGDIDVHSEVGAGARFRVRLPGARMTATAAEIAEEELPTQPGTAS